MDTVTVTFGGKKSYVVTFSKLPGQSFGPWDMAEAVRDLQVSALLDPLAARNLVLEAAVSGTATTEVGIA